MEINYALGNSGIRVTPIGLGCWQFSGGKGLAGSFWRGLAQEEVNRIVGAALSGGISWFDTAEAYGNGVSERSLSRALEAAGVEPGSVTIATKWMPVARTARSLRTTFPARSRSLAPYPIDLHQVHNPASFSSAKREMEEMARLKEEGLIRAVGVSNFSAKRMRAAHDALAEHGIPLSTNQVRYSLLDRGIERNGVLETARELGVTVIAYSPLSQGILTGRFHEDPEQLERLTGPRKLMPRFKPAGLAKSAPLISLLGEIAEAHGATVAQVALAWTIRRNGESVVAIPGASSVRQVESNVAAMSLTLTADEIGRLDDVSAAVR
jgi:aryl-alcohol dehydrogenase-like predicted oxidoreductase